MVLPVRVRIIYMTLGIACVTCPGMPVGTPAKAGCSGAGASVGNPISVSSINVTGFRNLPKVLPWDWMGMRVWNTPMQGLGGRTGGVAILHRALGASVFQIDGTDPDVQALVQEAMSLTYVERASRRAADD
eukprot:4587504-Amphidinium_carterae.1